MTSPIRELSDQYVERNAELNPVAATSRGIVGHDGAMTDYSPQGIEERLAHDRDTLRQLEALRADTEDDRLAAAVMSERLRVSLAYGDAGELFREVRVLGGTLGGIRQVFDVMPRSTDDEWMNIASRLEAVPQAVAGVEASIREGVRRGLPPARRQVLACAEQAGVWSGQRDHRPYFATLADGYSG